MNKLLDEYNNTYHRSISKKTIDVEYSALTKKLNRSIKLPKFKVLNGVRIAKYKNIVSKGYTKSWSKEIFVIDSVPKTNPLTYKIKDLKVKKIIGSFYEK